MPYPIPDRHKVKIPLIIHGDICKVEVLFTGGVKKITYKEKCLKCLKCLK